jgi:hypothetical protein
MVMDLTWLPEPKPAEPKQQNKQTEKLREKGM